MRPGYKLTDAGIVPETWDATALGEIVDFKNGRPHESKIREGGKYHLITLDSIDISGDLKNVHKQTDFWDSSLAKDDIVAVLSDLAHGDLLGLCDLIPEDGKYVLNQRMGRLTLKADADPRFVRLQINRRQNHFKIRGQGTSQRHIYKRDFDALAIPFPTISEQRVIADALSDVSKLLGELTRLVVKKRDLRQGAMQRLLTGLTRLPGFTAPWRKKRLGEVLRVWHGRSQKEVEVANGPVPILASGGTIGWASRPLYAGPSVLIGRKGTIDKPQYMATPFWSVDTLFYCEMLRGNDAKFLYYRFLLIEWRQFNEASGVPSLNARTIENIEILCPDPDEQAAIAKLLTDMDDEIAALEVRLDKTRALKRAMMQALLTGRVRLPFQRDAAPKLKEAAHA